MPQHEKYNLPNKTWTKLTQQYQHHQNTISQQDMEQTNALTQISPEQYLPGLGWGDFPSGIQENGTFRVRGFVIIHNLGYVVCALY